MYNILKPLKKKTIYQLIFLFITSVIGNMLMLYFPFATQYLLDELVTKMQLKPVVIWALIAIAVAVAAYAFYFYFVEYLSDRCIVRLANEMRDKMMQKLLTMKIYPFEKTDKGMLFNTVMAETNVAATAYFNNHVMLYASLLQIAVYMTIVVLVNKKVAVAVVIAIPLFAVLSQLNNRKFTESVKEERHKMDGMIGCYRMIVNNKRDINNIGKETFFGNMMSEKIGQWGDTRIRYHFFYTFLKILPTWLNQSTMIIVYAIGAAMVIAGEMSIGEWVMISQVIGYLFQEIANVISIRVDLKDAKPLFERINKIMEFDLEVDNQYEYGDKIDIQEAEVFADERELFYVEKFVIENQGVYIIEAENGMGKSYFMKCILGVASGIRGDKHNYVPKAEHIALFEKNDLFVEDTGIHNVFLGEKCNQQFWKEMQEIFDLDFTEKQVELNPLNLSLGEQQKILLCRFMWFNREKEYWILDEPLVNLDVDSAKKFAEYIANLSQRKRIIVISHDEVFYRYAKVKYKIENKKMILQAIND